MVGCIPIPFIPFCSEGHGEALAFAAGGEESKTLAQMSTALAECSQSGNFTPGRLNFG